MVSHSLYEYVVYSRYLFFIGLAIYAFVDWRKNKKYFYKAEDGSEIRNPYLSRFAWGFKILIIYTLGSNLLISVLPIAEISHNLLHPSQTENDLMQMRFQNLVLPAEVILGDQIPKTDEIQNHVYISTGSIPVFTKNAEHFILIEFIIQLVIAVSLSLILIRLFSSSVTKPFSIENVNRIRLLAVIGFLYQIITLVLNKISSEIVKSQYDFPVSHEFLITNIDYSPYFLCIAVLLLAELVRLGWVVKEEQDLTV